MSPVVVQQRTAYRFAHGMRLDSAGVAALLKGGKIISDGKKAALQIRVLTSSRGHGARLAIAVPKRILARSVDRNRVKRAVREVFRYHALRYGEVDLLVNLSARIDPSVPEGRQHLRAALSDLFDRALARAIPGG